MTSSSSDTSYSPWTLPPKLSGPPQGQLTFQLIPLHPEGDLARVRVTWWGQKTPALVELCPDGTASLVKFDVVTSEKRFRDYLQDAKRLEMMVEDVEGRVVGVAFVKDLVQVLDGGRLEQEVEVIDDYAIKIGSFKCEMRFRHVESQEKVTKTTTHPRPTRPIYRPTPKRMSPVSHAPKRMSPISHAPKRTSPTSQAAKKASRTSHAPKKISPMSHAPKRKSKPAPTRSDEDRPRVTFSDANVLQEEQPRIEDVLARSKRRLASYEQKKTSKKEEKENRRPPQHHPLPSWNLSTARLKFISSVTQIAINIHHVSLNKTVADSILGGKPNSASRIILRSRERQTQNLIKSFSTKDASSSSLSFFVSYTVPPNQEATNHCSRKLKNQDITFGHKSVHPTVFKPDLLDIWWTSDLTFKFLSRALSQRTPTCIAQATIGLKYLLTDPNNSCGKVMKLPLYASTKFFSDNKLDSEIIGDLFVSFTLAKKREDFLQGRTVSPQRAVRDGESEDLGDKEEEESYEDVDVRPSRDHFSETVVLKSRGQISQPQSPSKCLPQATSKPLKSPLVFCFLNVPEGRNFAMDVSSGPAPSLFLHCRFMTSEDAVQSQICWNSTRPEFHMKHYLPLPLDVDFLVRCKENYLVVEVWNFGKPTSKVVGVAMIPLQQFYLAFKDPGRRDYLLGLDMPVVAFDDWISVTDLATGSEKGQIRVTLAAGSKDQMRHLLQIWEETPKSIISVEKEKDDEEAETVSEHIYDTVEEASEEEEYLEEFQRLRSEEEDQRQKKSTVFQRDFEPVRSIQRHSERKTAFRVYIHIDEARNLPRVFDALCNKKKSPSTFVTFSSLGDPSTVVTNIVRDSRDPRWDKKYSANICKETFTDPRRHFILKLWHHATLGPHVDLETDHVIGFAAIDLNPLVTGFPSICGWYNIMDFVGRCRGQIKVTITPQDDPKNLKNLPLLARRQSDLYSSHSVSNEFSVCAKYEDFPSHVVPHTEQLISSLEKSQFENLPKSSESTSCQTSTLIGSTSTTPEISLESAVQHWQPPLHEQQPEESSTRSVLLSKLGALDETTAKMRLKLEEDQQQERAENIDDCQRLEELRKELENKIRLIESSREKVEVLESSEEDLSESAGPPRELLADIRESTLEDLGTIDWDQILVAPPSRQGPEGGNPNEDRSSQMSFVKK